MCNKMAHLFDTGRWKNKNLWRFAFRSNQLSQMDARFARFRCTGGGRRCKMIHFSRLWIFQLLWWNDAEGCFGIGAGEFCQH